MRISGVGVACAIPPGEEREADAMKTEYQYIRFDQYSVPSAKTSHWFCVNRRSGVVLAEIKWYGPWRQYCVFPFHSTVYSAGCLADTQDFLGQLMAE